MSWRAFPTAQAPGWLACDLPHVDTGLLRRIHAFFAIDIETRQAHILGAAANPPGPWVVQQARSPLTDWGDDASPFTTLIRDRDSAFTPPFDDVFAAIEIRVIDTLVRAPRANT